MEKCSVVRVTVAGVEEFDCAIKIFVDGQSKWSAASERKSAYHEFNCNVPFLSFQRFIALVEPTPEKLQGPLQINYETIVSWKPYTKIEDWSWSATARE